METAKRISAQCFSRKPLAGLEKHILENIKKIAILSGKMEPRDAVAHVAELFTFFHIGLYCQDIYFPALPFNSILQRIDSMTATKNCQSNQPTVTCIHCVCKCSCAVRNLLYHPWPIASQLIVAIASQHSETGHIKQTILICIFAAVSMLMAKIQTSQIKIK